MSTLTWPVDYIIKTDALGWRMHRLKHSLVVSASRGAFLVRQQAAYAAAAGGAAGGAVVELWQSAHEACGSCTLALKGTKKLQFSLGARAAAAAAASAKMFVLAFASREAAASALAALLAVGAVVRTGEARAVRARVRARCARVCLVPAARSLSRHRCSAHRFLRRPRRTSRPPTRSSWTRRRRTTRARRAARPRRLRARAARRPRRRARAWCHRCARRS